MNKGKLALGIAALLLLAAQLGGCIGVQEQDGPPRDAAKRVISFVVPEYSTATKPQFESLVKDFEAIHPDVEIALQVINWDFLDSAYNTMISKNQPPDLLITNVYAHFARDGLLSSMEDIVSPALKSRFYPVLLNNGTMGGVLYALPYVASTREMYYNKDIFDELGIAEPPRTWTELEETARKIKELKREDGFGLDFTDNEIWAYLSYFFIGAGGGWMKDGKWTINSPENVEGLTFLLNLYEKGLTDAEPTVTTRDEKQRILGNGKLGMMISGNYFTAVVPREFPGLKWRLGPIPVKKGIPPFVFGVQDMLMAFKTDHTDKKALSQFLDFLYEDGRYEDVILREGLLPVTRTVGGKLAAQDSSLKQTLDSLQTAKFYPYSVPAWSAVLDATRNMGQSVLLGQLTPQQALDQLQQIAVAKSR
ncbi:hypothetical protein SD70_06795 [Gordoniibacillus kamchatkensis]|uniref:Sugar ABC transporter substrate-binding protein n=1 Tax=Gordoniibacillus kamchatkensis TaxID=1590651 RepID=A0ABR5AM03_9BACL|nr:extracellular solute-binding protein [Paenibacillus sp. VKM B-2647]KIL41560.1 hypothetical protein SD70_06795 [Paenibacillus sp. VKM B-2647]